MAELETQRPHHTVGSGGFHGRVQTQVRVDAEVSRKIELLVGAVQISVGQQERIAEVLIREKC